MNVWEAVEIQEQWVESDLICVKITFVGVWKMEYRNTTFDNAAIILAKYYDRSKGVAWNQQKYREM